MRHWKSADAWPNPRFTESEAMYNEALEIYRRLANSTPQAYEPDVAQTLNNLANLYSDTQRFTDSEAMYKEALEIYRRLAESNPQAYESNVAVTLNNLAVLYYDTKRFTESEAMYNEALEIRRRLKRRWKYTGAWLSPHLNSTIHLWQKF